MVQRTQVGFVLEVIAVNPRVVLDAVDLIGDLLHGRQIRPARMQIYNGFYPVRVGVVQIVNESG